jgi:hypothetical protein
MVIDNTYDVLATMSPLAHVRFERANELVAFLAALTDETSLDLAHLIPAQVPSGLPVAD